MLTESCSWPLVCVDLPWSSRWKLAKLLCFALSHFLFKEYLDRKMTPKYLFWRTWGLIKCNASQRFSVCCSPPANTDSLVIPHLSKWHLKFLVWWFFFLFNASLYIATQENNTCGECGSETAGSVEQSQGNPSVQTSLSPCLSLRTRSLFVCRALTCAAPENKQRGYWEQACPERVTGSPTYSSFKQTKTASS